MKLLKLFSTLFLTIHLSGCGEYFSSEVYVTGKVGEVVVVCDDAIWNSSFRSDLDSNLTRFIMPYFPDVATFEYSVALASKKFACSTPFKISVSHGKGCSLTLKRIGRLSCFSLQSAI